MNETFNFIFITIHLERVGGRVYWEIGKRSENKERERKMGLGINTRNGQGPHVTCRSFLSSCISFKLIEYLFLINCFLPFL